MEVSEGRSAQSDASRARRKTPGAGQVLAGAPRAVQGWVDEHHGMNQELDSPCIRVCRVEAGICQGCGRTLDEIARWPNATPLVKRIILAAAKARLRTE
jgi:uncharacterized protein